MAAVASPVELPTGRRSYYAPPPSLNIRDPNYIPLLNGIDVRSNSPIVEKELSPYHAASFARPNNSKIAKSTKAERSGDPSLLHSTSTSSIAQQTALQELDAGPVSRRLSQSSETALIEAHAAASESTTSPKSASEQSAERDDVASASEPSDSRRASGEASTAYAGSIVEEQFHVTPSHVMGRDGRRSPTVTDSARSSKTPSHIAGRDGRRSPAITDSARSSVTSSTTKVKAVIPPVSKYNRKPVPSMASSRPTTIASTPRSTHDSPRPDPTSSAANVVTAIVQTPTPTHDTAVIPSVDPPVGLLSPPLQHRTSTASERRSRALNSHPSNPSLKDRSVIESLSEETEMFPKPPNTRVPRKSTESRPTTPRKISSDIRTAPPKSATPGSQIPAIPKRSSVASSMIKAEQIPQDASPVPPLPSYQANDHTEMASFMAKNNTVIFRRFDDVHVRLLLCLQDEIAQWERELIEVESVGTLTGDKIGQKARIMRELRRVVAEYDHLFSNWSQMQANKADEQTMQVMQKWLKNPTSDVNGSAAGAKEDLQWLEHTKDLSSVILRAKSPSPQPQYRPVQQPTMKPESHAGGNWFSSLFSCTR